MGSVDKALAKRVRDVHSKENFKRRIEREEQDRVVRKEKAILQTSKSEQESGNDNEAFDELSSSTTSNVNVAHTKYCRQVSSMSGYGKGQ